MNHTIVDSLYAKMPSPDALLYHYTSLDAAMGILESGKLFASDIGYLNDSSELIHALDFFRIEGEQRWSAKGETPNPELLTQFLRFLEPSGFLLYRSLYISSFTGNGNLLSQWRGYCPASKGVSLGFYQEAVASGAERQGFSLGKCIYDDEKNMDIARVLIKTIQSSSLERGINTNLPDDINYQDILIAARSDIIQSAALLKDSSFKEEEEWRIVSSPMPYVDPGINFRPGKTSIIPYLLYKLPTTDAGNLALRHSYLGPTTNPQRSIQSFKMLLAKHQVNREEKHQQPISPSVSHCSIPYVA